MTVGFGVDGGSWRYGRICHDVKPAIMAKVELIALAQHHYFVCRAMDNSCYNVACSKWWCYNRV